MSNSGSLTRTAITAVALTIGFYTLAIAASATLLYVAYWFAVHQTAYRVVLFCGIGGGAILWSILPRFDRFTPPGPRLEPDEQPELFAILRDVAQKTGQEMPEDVYLIADVNAYVAHRGGIMGVGSRRIMGVGLALMQSVSVPQLRAIIAHEFGHYHHGDLKFARWIYKTRLAIERTVINLSRHASWLTAPFRGYAKLFIRITQSISRAQEFAADRLAASVAGAKEMIDALVAVRCAASAFGSYFETELAPVLNSGFRPPIAAGFTAFMAAPPVKRAIEEVLPRIVAEEQTDVEDSHPPLRERVAALGEMPTELATGMPRATTLLHDLNRLEAELVVAMAADAATARSLKAVAWEQAPERVYVPAWKERAENHATTLRGATAMQAPELMIHLRESGAGVVGSAIAAKLHDAGWVCAAMPGQPVTFLRDGRTFEPFSMLTRVASGDVSAEQWAEECRGAGIDSLPLL